MLGLTKTESPEQRRKREEREAEADRVAKMELARLPARQMERLMAETVSEETVGDISVYRKYVARRAADKDDLDLRKECAAAMKKLKIPPTPFSLTLANTNGSFNSNTRCSITIKSASKPTRFSLPRSKRKTPQRRRYSKQRLNSLRRITQSVIWRRAKLTLTFFKREIGACSAICRTGRHFTRNITFWDGPSKHGV